MRTTDTRNSILVLFLAIALIFSLRCELPPCERLADVSSSPNMQVIPAATTTTATQPRLTYLGKYRVTGYADCAHCHSLNGETASGITAQVGRTIAMCDDFPFGTRIYIEGLGEYVVEDRGVGRCVVDVYCNTHEECYALTGYYDVYIINY